MEVPVFVRYLNLKPVRTSVSRTTEGGVLFCQDGHYILGGEKRWRAVGKEEAITR